ncbi:MAG TPA: hypothetical protein VMN56_06505 [Casimicrobiaceae bacterium]|nr:hypothetical protein [Casimicrobiaceae bacterium]
MKRVRFGATFALLLAAPAAFAAGCNILTDRYVQAVAVVANNKVTNADVNLNGWPRPVLIVWMAPPGWEFKDGDINVQNDTYQKFSSGRIGEYIWSGIGSSRFHHICDENDDSKKYEFTIQLRNASATIITDPVIVNDGGSTNPP